MPLNDISASILSDAFFACVKGNSLYRLSTENLYFDGETFKTFIFLRKTFKNLYFR